MGRRKSRSSSPSSSKPGSKKSKTSSSPSVFEGNPFWKIYGSDYNHTPVGIEGSSRDDDCMVVDDEKRGDSSQVDHVLDDMLRFMELSKKRNLGHDSITVDDGDAKDREEQNQKLFEEIVESLLAYMNGSNEPTDQRASKLGVLVSGEDVARLLLPWSIKGILHISHKKKPSAPRSLELLYWKTLNECLGFFLGRIENQEDGASSKDRNRNNSFNILTLSTMHKLVPVALGYSLQESCDVSDMDTSEDERSTVSLQEIARTCFCRLVDHLYRPPFDVICDTLLPILTRDSVRASDSRRAIWVGVTTSTIQLMNLRIASANPKKSFQLLIRRNVFLDLAIVNLCISHSKHFEGNDTTSSQIENIQLLQSLFSDFIRNGLFSLEHHMDGYRSLQLAIPGMQIDVAETVAKSTASNAKASFRGYQEGLFQVVENFLIPSDSSCKTGEFSSKDAMTVSCVLPLLLNLFLQQVSNMQKQKVASKTHKKNKVSDKLGQLQFRFFACLTGYIVKGLISFKGAVTNFDSGLRLSFFAILGENLDLLLTHNIYQPSLGNNAERAFLDQIGKEIIQSIAGRAEDTNIAVSFPEWKKSLGILDVLIKLNHTILHDQLAGIIARCLAFDSSYQSNSEFSGICEEASNFLVTIIATYGRLRQLDYFYLRLFDAIQELSQQNDIQRIRHHLALANDRGVSFHLGRAIQESPIQQLQKIFSNVNDSIASGSFRKGNKFSQEVTAVARAVVTKIFVGLLQNVRVDSNSFNDIYPICREILNGSVVSLIRSDGENAGETSENTGNINNALMLCAWTIHLKNRCEFWIDTEQIELSKEQSFGIPTELLRILTDATTSDRFHGPDSNTSDPDVQESLKFLACQRIQQLHGECHEKQRLAYATNAKEYSIASETSEARKLVGFILQRRDLDGVGTRSTSEMMRQLTVLAESITIWAPHAIQDNIDAFLNQLLHSVADAGVSCRSDRNLLLSLLNDSSFYEIPNVSQRLGVNIASFVAEIMQNVIRQCDDSPDIECSTLQRGWKNLTIEGAANIEQSGMSLICDAKNLPETNNYLGAMLRVLDIVNDIGNPIWKDCEDAPKIFQSLMQVESVCNMLGISKERSFLDKKIRVVSALRTAASRVLTTVHFDSIEWAFETKKENYIKLLARVLENSFGIIDQDSSSSTVHQCINSFTMIAESLVDIYLASGTRSAMYTIKILDSTFNQAAVARGGFEYLLLTNYAVILLRKFGRLLVESDDASMTEFSRVIKRRIWNKSQEFCFDAPKDTPLLFQNQSIVFIAETLRHSSTSSDSQLVPLSSVENKIVSRLRTFLTRDSDDLESRSISYLIGCLAMAKPSRIVRQELTYQLLLANLKRSDMFATPLCILANGMETDEFDEFLSKLTSNIVDVTATAKKLRILHTIVLSATNKSQIDVLSNHSAIILNNCLQVMAQVARQTDNDSDSILEVSSLIVDMASQKDMMVLRERDIALILARITSTINIEEESGEVEITETQLKAFEACFSLVSLFLQRFSKQVHNCVPSLVISLTTMLQFALSKSMPTDSMASCGQMFSRLCELLLPHGDVYKKHIICLILRFVNSLRNDIHPVAKKSLLPGIYCLLDIIQEHETMQLNSMLDEECRALLRSIHEGYKKIHVYKGQ